jgi:predicted regulator of Ras-like GTPase activity (Roadblock/LC7/MglB family)
VSGPAPEPASVSASPGAAEQGLKQRLQALAGTPGVRFVVLTDREGFLIETAGDLAPDADEVTGALGFLSGRGLGRHRARARPGAARRHDSRVRVRSLAACTVSGPSALLAVLVGDQGALGKVRYYVRKTVPELVRAL